MTKIKIIPLYERLSRDNKLNRESNSISNQKSMLEDYARRNGFPDPTPLNVIEEAAQICLKKSSSFSIMESWQRQESEGISAVYEKGGRCH